jgi:hypothetical protein
MMCARHDQRGTGAGPFCKDQLVSDPPPRHCWGKELLPARCGYVSRHKGRPGPETAHAWLVPPSLSTMHDHQPQRDVHKLMLVASTVWAQRSTNRNSLGWATMTREHSATTVRAWTWKQGGARFLGCTLTSSLNLVGYKFARVGFRKKNSRTVVPGALQHATNLLQECAWPISLEQ